jgi:biotin operon repressor
VSQILVRKPSQKLVQERYGRTPYSVLLDKRLTASARCVYAFLASTVFQGTVASVGQRRIAGQLGISTTTVTQAIKELAAYGHVEVVSAGKQRYCYHMKSSIFGQKQAALDAGESIVEELVSFPRRQLATVRKTA